MDKLERIKLLQDDPLIDEMNISIKSPSAISRFLKRFDFRTTHSLRRANFKLFKKLLKQSELRNIIIDIDSSVINVEGHQEGAAKGYNPKKKGNNCYNY